MLNFICSFSFKNIGHPLDGIKGFTKRMFIIFSFKYSLQSYLKGYITIILVFNKTT